MLTLAHTTDTSKLAAAKFFEYIHYEHPDLFVLNVHPGVIQTGMAAKAQEGGTNMPFDESKLLPIPNYLLPMIA